LHFLRPIIVLIILENFLTYNLRINFINRISVYCEVMTRRSWIERKIRRVEKEIDKLTFETWAEKDEKMKEEQKRKWSVNESVRLEEFEFFSPEAESLLTISPLKFS